MQNILSVLLILFACLSACKKSGKTISKTKTDYLTQTAWKRTQYTLTLHGGLTSDFFTSLPAYTKDNLYIFSSSKTFTCDEGATKNNAAVPQLISTGSWNFFNGETILNIKIGNDAINHDIIQLDDNILKLQITTVNGSDTTTADFTYVH